MINSLSKYPRVQAGLAWLLLCPIRRYGDQLSSLAILQSSSWSSSSSLQPTISIHHRPHCHYRRSRIAQWQFLYYKSFSTSRWSYLSGFEMFLRQWNIFSAFGEKVSLSLDFTVEKNVVIKRITISGTTASTPLSHASLATRMEVALPV